MSIYKTPFDYRLGNLEYCIGKGGLGYKPKHYIIGGATEKSDLTEDEVEEIKKKNEEKIKRLKDETLERELKSLESLPNTKYKHVLINAIKQEQEKRNEEFDKEFEEQMKYYEDNYDDLDEVELDNYISGLALLKEKNEKNEGEAISDLDKKIYKAVKYQNNILDSPFVTYKDSKDYENEIMKTDKLDDTDIERYVNEIRISTNKPNFGLGKAFEEFILNVQNKVQKYTKDNSPIVSNDTNPKFMKKVNFKGNEMLENEFLIFDLSQKKTDIECKYYTGLVNTKDSKYYIPTKDDIEKDGLILQSSKYGNKFFMPLYTKINGQLKLYNIYSSENDTWVNEDFNKDVDIIYQTKAGTYMYELNNDANIQLEKNVFDGDEGEALYKIKPKYKTAKDGHGMLCYKIPFNKLKKIHL